MTQEKPTTTSVALVIYSEDRSKFLLVKRPEDDPAMAGHWGFPAASKKSLKETWEETIFRAAKTKLGIEVRVVKMLGEDTIDRGSYILVLRDYEVEIVAGQPLVPQPFEGVTQYVDQKWTDDVVDLQRSAREGSLCARVFLRARNLAW
jgi:ADP-ribose pyrophosphatase YjhB (NUDIX family)